MSQQKFCQNCDQRNKCQDVYQQLGKTKGPPVVFKVVVAFLLPLVVFIGSLAAFEAVLAKAINANRLQATVSFLLALGVTAVLMLIIKVVNRQLTKSK